MNTNTNNEGRNNQTFAEACVAQCGKLINQLERVKNNITAEFRDVFETQEQLLNRTIREAEALAWQTEYPQLVFPTLAMEKVQNVAGWNARQQAIRRSTSAFEMAA
jgi:hypothetical protein